LAIQKNRHRRQGVIVMAVLFLLTVGMAFALPGREKETALSSASTSGRSLPIYSVERTDRKIAITFDAASGASDTDALLGILSLHQVPATFFLCGCWMRNHPQETIRLYSAGHEIGNHGDNHLDPVGLSAEALQKEIEDASEELRNLVGIRPALYRPAYGSYDNTVIQTARDLGYEAIQWSVDSLDWMEEGIDEMTSRVLTHAELRDGAILLFHNDTKYTAQALDTILTKLKEQGYTMVTVSDLLWPGSYSLDHTGRQYSTGLSSN
jgi:peptidoglycan/xylan/chitin deacetylase (PgdA/CDA1 family)